MSAFAGVGALTRLALRLDRVRLPVWVIAIALLPPTTAAQYQQLYPNEAAIARIAGVVANPSLTAINGPMFGATLGGLTVWKIGATEFVLAALMSFLTVVRHTRADEESGRLELVRAGVVGRHAPLTAALLAVGLANLAVALGIAGGLASTGLALAGSVAFGLAIGAAGMLFAAVGAVAVQLTESARAATSIAASVLGAAYLARALGDTGPTWLTWISPAGWAMRVRPFAGEQWWLLALSAALAVSLLGVAFAVAARRDLGAGLIAQRSGPAAAAPSLRSPLALAWRLNRGVLFGWVAGMVLWGATLGGAADGVGHAIGANQAVTDMLERLGGRKGLVDAYLAAVLGMTGLVVAAYAVQATLRLRAEETSGRAEPLLATRVGRVRWVMSLAIFAVVGSAALLAIAGAAAGLTYGLRIGDLGQVPRLVGAALVQLPAVWVFAGLGVALFGLVPRFAALTWAGLIACMVLLELGALVGLSQQIVDLSPFAHVPKLPGSTLSALPLVLLTAVACVLGAAGLVGFRRRDVG